VPKKKDQKKPGKSAAPGPPAAGDDAAARKRVALLRQKLAKAMDDPLMRDQIVKAIRAMMAGGG
jgi:hypothetical protein